MMYIFFVSRINPQRNAHMRRGKKERNVERTRSWELEGDGEKYNTVRDGGERMLSGGKGGMGESGW